MRLQVTKLGKVAVTVEQEYWSETKDYDRLVIVESETLGTTYISRKEVPAGTSLTDREYWIPIGVTKGASDVTDLYKQVQELQEKVAKLTAESFNYNDDSKVLTITSNTITTKI